MSKLSWRNRGWDALCVSAFEWGWDARGAGSEHQQCLCAGGLNDAGDAEFGGQERSHVGLRRLGRLRVPSDDGRNEQLRDCGRRDATELVEIGTEREHVQQL